MVDPLINKLIIDLCLQIEDTFESLNHAYHYSNQNDPLFSDFFFGTMPSRSNDSNLINDMVLINSFPENPNLDKRNAQRSHFESVFYYAASCFNQLFIGHQNLESKPSQTYKSLFYDFSRAQLYSSCFTAITSKIFNFKLNSNYTSNFIEFFNNFSGFLHNLISYSNKIFNNPAVVSNYISISNLINCLGRFDLDLFSIYINESDFVSNFPHFCEDSLLLLQNDKSLEAFIQRLFQITTLCSTDEQRLEFFSKLYKILTNLFVTRPDLYRKALEFSPKVLSYVEKLIDEILDHHTKLPSSNHQSSSSTPSSLTQTDLKSIGSLDQEVEFPLLCILSPFLLSQDKFQSLIFSVFNEFLDTINSYENKIFFNTKQNRNSQSVCTKEIIAGHMQAYVSLYQSILASKSKHEKLVNPEDVSPMANFIRSIKDIIDKFVFRDGDSIDEIMSSEVVKYDLEAESLILLQTIYPLNINRKVVNEKDNLNSQPLSTNISMNSYGSSTSLISDSRIEYLNSAEFIHNFLPNYLALDIANIPNYLSVASTTEITIPLSVMYCLNSTDLNRYISLIRSLNLIMNGYPFDNVDLTTIKGIVTPIFQKLTKLVNLIQNQSNFLLLDGFYLSLFQLISGYSINSRGDSQNEFNLNGQFLDFIFNDNDLILLFLHFLTLMLRATDSKSSETNFNLEQFPSQTVSHFLILLYAVFEKPSRFTQFLNNHAAFILWINGINQGLYKLYKDLLHYKITALYCFDSLMMKYINFLNELLKPKSDLMYIKRIIDDVEIILLLMNATSDSTKSVLLNLELKKIAENNGVPFVYDWPLKRDQTLLEKTKFLSTFKFCYLFWFRSSFQLLHNLNFISFEKSDDAFEPIKKTIDATGKTTLTVYPVIKNKLKSTVTLNLISQLASFLCQYTIFFDDLIPVLTKYEIKNPKIKFLNTLLEFVLFDITDLNKFISKTIPQLDGITLRLVFRIIRTNLLSNLSIFSFSSSFSSLIFKPITKTSKGEPFDRLNVPESLYLVILNLLSGENIFYDTRRHQFDDQYYTQGEDLILNLIKKIQMNSRYSIIEGEKSLSYKNRLSSISKILIKFYSYDYSSSSNQLNRLTIISTLLSHGIALINQGNDSKIALVVLSLTPLPVLFKNFTISAKNGISPHISDYDDHSFIQKSLSNFLTSFSLILSLTDEIELFSIIQESLENLLLNNFYETLEVIISSLFNYLDKFQKIILNALIFIISKSPELLSKTSSNPLFSEITSNNFHSILFKNINSVYYYEAVIDVCISQNKIHDLFIAFCNQSKQSLYFFIAFFKIAATQKFLNEFALNLLLMKLEKTIETFIPPLQFVYYWQLYCKLTKEEPFSALDKFFLRPIMLQPHIYNLHISASFNSSQASHFIQEIKAQKRMTVYLDHLMNSHIDYFEVHLSRFEFNRFPVISHFIDSTRHPANFISFSNIRMDPTNQDLQRLNRFDLVEMVFSFIDSQCLVCIDENIEKKEKWLFDMSKFPSSSLPILHECLRVLFLANSDQKDTGFSTFYEETIELSPKRKERSDSWNSSTTPINETQSSEPKKSKHSLKFKLFHKSSKQPKDNESLMTSQPEFALNSTDEDNLFTNITLYIDLRALPKNYLAILDNLFNEKFKNVYLIWPPIGILTEIESKIIEKKKGVDDIKVLPNVDKETDIILPFHLPKLRLTTECKVNDKLGSIGFFLEYIVISTYEIFKGQEYQVSTIFTFSDVKPLKPISKTVAIVEFKERTKLFYDSIKYSDIILNFDLNAHTINQANLPSSSQQNMNFTQNNNDANLVLPISIDSIMTAFERSLNCDICDKSVLHQYYCIDPKIALIAFSLTDLPNYTSIISEASIRLLDLCINTKPHQTEFDFSIIKSNQKNSMTQKAAENLSLPLDGIIKILQNINYKNSTLFNELVLFIAPWLSNASERGMSMMTTLIKAFISISKDELSLSFICRNLLQQFDESNQAIRNAKQKLNGILIQSNTQRKLSMPNHDSPSLPKVLSTALANKDFQLLHIWSVVKSSLFTRIAIPQILVYVGSSTIQSQLISCLAAKNKKEVSHIVFEEFLHNDLISFHLYQSIFSSKLFNMLQSLQILGNEETVIFLSLVVALTASETDAQPFIDSLINSKCVNGLTNSTQMFEPDSSDLLDSFNTILDNLDLSIKTSVIQKFEKLNQDDNPNIWYLNPKIEPTQLLDEMSKSFVPVFQTKKLCFILSKLKYQKDKLKQLFWIALPLLFSKHSCIIMNSIKLINELFEYYRESDVFEDISQLLKSNSHLLNAVKTFYGFVNINIQSELPSTLASILFMTANSLETKELTLTLMQNICLANLQNPAKMLEFILLLFVFGEKHDQVVLKQIKNEDSASQLTRLEVIINTYIHSKSLQSTIWIVLFILRSFKLQLLESKFLSLAKCLVLILNNRIDAAILLHNHLLSQLQAVINSKESKEQICIAHLIALVNSQGQLPPSKETDMEIEKVQKMFTCVNIQEQHLHSYCVIIQNAIKGML